MKTVNEAKLPLIDYRTLEPFQDNLKDLDTPQHDKLLASLERHGFFAPAFVWVHDGKHYLLDGHQRHRVLSLNEIEFENTGFEVPYVAIYAANIKEAKEKILLISSQYGRITQEGLDEFAAIAEIELEDIALNFDALPDQSLDLTTDEEDDDKDEKAKSGYSIKELRELRDTFMELTGRGDNGFIEWVADRK